MRRFSRFVWMLSEDVADILDDSYRRTIPTARSMAHVLRGLLDDYAADRQNPWDHARDRELRWQAIHDQVAVEYLAGNLDLHP